MFCDELQALMSPMSPSMEQRMYARINERLKRMRESVDKDEVPDLLCACPCKVTIRCCTCKNRQAMQVGEPSFQNQTEYSPNTTRIVGKWDIGIELKVFVTVEVSRYKYWVHSEENKIEMAHIEALLDHAESQAFEPTQFSFCMYESVEGRRYRARVLSLSPTRIFLPDYGYQLLVEPNMLRQLPDAAKKIPMQATQIQFVNKAAISKCFTVESELLVLPVQVTLGGTYMVKLLKCVKLVETRMPEPELQEGPCVMNSYQSPHVLNVSPATPFMLRKMAFFERQLEDHYMSTFRKVSNPEVGKIVACLSSVKQKYARALVVKIDIKIKVQLIDYGVDEVVTKQNLYVLPKVFQRDAPFSAEVTVVNVLHAPITKAAKNFLQECIDTKEKLIMAVVSQTKTRVIFHLKGGRLFSDVINTFLLQNGTQFPLSKMNCFQLPVDEEVPFFVVGTFGTNVIAGCHVNDKDKAKKIQLGMINDINTYCSEQPQESYVPQPLEVCFVKHGAGWYRASCLETGNRESHVLLLDYGDESNITHRNIRPMVPAFYHPPGLIYCFLQANSGTWNRTIERLSVHRVYVLSKLTSNTYLVNLLESDVYPSV